MGKLALARNGREVIGLGAQSTQSRFSEREAIR